MKYSEIDFRVKYEVTFYHNLEKTLAAAIKEAKKKRKKSESDITKN